MATIATGEGGEEARGEVWGGVAGREVEGVQVCVDDSVVEAAEVGVSNARWDEAT